MEDRSRSMPLTRDDVPELVEEFNKLLSTKKSPAQLEAEQRIVALEQALSSIKGENAALVARLKEQTQVPQPHPTTTFAPMTMSRPKYPEPKPFDGDKSTYENWKLAVKNKLEKDVPEEDRASYLFAYTTGPVQTYVRDFMAERHSVCTYQDILLYLDKLYGDTHLQQKATAEFFQFRMQRHELFEDFLTKFETLKNRSKLGLADDVLVNVLESKLTESLRSAVSIALASNKEARQEYSSFVDVVRRVAPKTAAPMPFQPNIPPPINISNRTASRPRYLMTPALAPPPRSPQPMRPLTVSEGGDAMDVDTARVTQKRRLPHLISRNEFMARMRANACTTCGGQGHYARQCQYRPHVNQERFSVSTMEASMSTEDTTNENPDITYHSATAGRQLKA